MANTQEYGLFQLLDLQLLNPNAAANTVDSGLLVSAIQYDQAQHNADIAAMLNLFCEDTTEFQQEVQQTGSSYNQPLDENGRSIPIKPSPPYTVQHLIQGSGNALGYNFRTKAKMTTRDLAGVLRKMYRGDTEWVTRHILNGLFSSAGYTARDIDGHGSLSIKGMANGDSTTFYKSGANTESTDNHYLAQAAAISDAANPFPLIRADLVEHPDNGTDDPIVFIPDALETTTKALADFEKQSDPNVRLGANTAVLTGAFPAVTLPPGARWVGRTDGTWVAVWSRLPSDVMAAITPGGRAPLARRIDKEAELNGFRPQGTRDDFPYFEEQWSRWEGYSALNRVGAVLYRVGNASWADPTGYGTFLP